jgi:hypothetical protein
MQASDRRALEAEIESKLDCSDKRSEGSIWWLAKIKYSTLGYQLSLQSISILNALLLGNKFSILCFEFLEVSSIERHGKEFNFVVSNRRCVDVCVPELFTW